MRLRTTLGEDLYERFRGPLRQYLLDVDAAIGLTECRTIEIIQEELQSAEQQHQDGPDELFDDLYILRCWAEFFGHYGHLWRLIADESFSASWNKLQDALDSLRVVRRFSSIDVSGLETQLVELERIYPYSVFFSAGLLVEKFECSICGKDIDSFECPHRKGQLYRGRMAVGIARNIVDIDHLAVVTQPKDRRCVVIYEDTGKQFKLVRFLSDLLRKRLMKVSDFGVLLFSKRLRPNPEYRRLGRNEPCFCASGLKFKRCCITKTHIEGDHVDIAPRPLSVEHAVD